MSATFLGHGAASVVLRRHGGYPRLFSTLPPPIIPNGSSSSTSASASGTLGGLVSTIADKLGMGEYVFGHA